MKIVGRGRPRVRFDRPEVVLLRRLFDELDDVLDPAAPPHPDDDDVRDRLFPAGYDDAAAAAEFRELTEESLRSDRRARIADCRADLAEGTEVALDDPDVVRRWLQVLNDLRLVHGTRLGISEDVEPEFDVDDPEQFPRIVYYWLSGVQDAVVQAVSG